MYFLETLGPHPAPVSAARVSCFVCSLRCAGILIGDEWAKALAGALEKNTALTALQLGTLHNAPSDGLMCYEKQNRAETKANRGTERVLEMATTGFFAFPGITVGGWLRMTYL